MDLHGPRLNAGWRDVDTDSFRSQIRVAEFQVCNEGLEDRFVEDWFSLSSELVNSIDKDRRVVSEELMHLLLLPQRFDFLINVDFRFFIFWFTIT